jgi:hypothetical protein
MTTIMLRILPLYSRVVDRVITPARLKKYTDKYIGFGFDLF